VSQDRTQGIPVGNKSESRSQWPRRLSNGSAAARLLGLRVRMPPGAWMSFVCCVFRQRSLRRADHSSRVVLPSLVCLSVIVKPRQWGGPGRLGAVMPGNTKQKWKTPLGKGQVYEYSFPGFHVTQSGRWRSHGSNCEEYYHLRSDAV